MTTEREREVALALNETLRERYPDTFQALRRCCICLLSRCEDRPACRAEFGQWAKRKWSDALQKEHERRHPGASVPAFLEGTGPGP